MAAFFGPESPRPFSVISENYQDKLNIPYYAERDRFSLGEAYEETMYKLIHKYLELDTHNRFCYVGEAKGSFAPLIQDKFCLLEPMVTILPGQFHYEETPYNRILPVRIANVGAEDYFRKEGRNCSTYRKPIFDRILVKDSIPFFDSPKDCYANMVKTLEEFGKIVFIHRPGPMNSLPYFTDAKQRLMENDQPYMKIISDLQSCGVDVQWEVETLPIIMPKVKWLSMLQDHYPPQMEILSDSEISMGIRELSEGILKYEGEMVEFMDRLLFITVSHSMTNDGYPSVQRHGNSGFKPFPGMQDINYKMSVTPDVRQYVIKRQKQDKQAGDKAKQLQKNKLW